MSFYMDFENALSKSIDARTQEEMNDVVQRFTHVGEVSTQMLRETMTRLFPDKNTVVTDEAEFRQREALSNKMQDTMKRLIQENFDAQLKRRQLGLKPPRGGFNRVLSVDTLLGLDTRNISMEEYTRRHNILANGSKQEKTELLMDGYYSVKYEAEAKGYNHERLTKMSDEEIVEHFEDIQRIMTWQSAVEGLLASNELSLDEEERQELLGFRDEFNTAALTYNRAKLIGSPYYAPLHVENVPTVMDNGVYELFEPEVMFPGQDGPDIEAQATAFLDMRKHFVWMQNFRSGVLLTEVENQLGGVPSNEIKWLDEQGKMLEPEYNSRRINANPYTPPLDGLRHGRPLTAILPDGTKKTFSMQILPGGGMAVPTESQPPMIPGTNKKLPLTEFMDRHIKAALPELSSALDKADPWYVKSSPAFKNVKAALKKVQQEWRALNGVPHPSEVKKLRKQMEALQTAASAYLDSKKGKENFNENERARFDAVREINMFATQQLSNVRTLDNHAAQRENADEREIFENAYSDIGIEKRQMRTAQHIREVRNFQRADETPGRVRKEENDAFIKRIWKANEYRNIPCPPSGPNQDNYALKKLLDSVVCSLEPMFTAATFSKVRPEQVDGLKRNMATLTAFHLIMTERGSDFNGEAGPLEQALTARGQNAMINSIKNSSAFNDLVGQITPERLNDFIMNDGARSIAKQLIDASRDRQHAAENPAPQRNA